VFFQADAGHIQKSGVN